MFKNKQMVMYGNQLKYLEQVKRELEGRKSKVGNLSYRKKLKQMQHKENYLSEIHRIRGVLSQNDNRLPIGTRERLEQRIKYIQKKEERKRKNSERGEINRAEISLLRFSQMSAEFLLRFLSLSLSLCTVHLGRRC